MKKWLKVPVIFLVLANVLLFSSCRRSTSSAIIGHRPMPGVTRAFHQTDRWAEWWPKGAGCTYDIKGVFLNEVRMTLHCAAGVEAEGAIKIAPLNGDSVVIAWEGEKGAGGKKDIQLCIDTVLGSFKAYIEDTKRLYGADFFQTKTNDSTLITIECYTGAYPNVEAVYARIDTLRKYMMEQRVEVMDSPWLNVAKVGEGRYKWTVALAVTGWLKGTDRIKPRRFVPWKMLEGEVHGGITTIERAFPQMDNYKTDYNLQVMALPYQCLITDRRQEADTTKWVTLVCAAIS
jgi:hypothetical protein